MFVTIGSPKFFNRFKNCKKRFSKEIIAAHIGKYERTYAQERNSEIHNNFHTNNIHFFRRAC